MKILSKHLLKLFILTLIIGLMAGTGNLFAGKDVSEYGHLSYLEGEATVTRLNKEQHKGILNLPIAPGDIIQTGAKGKCELQFDNGTLLRLDGNTSLKVETILASIITSNKMKLTTLRLLKGQVYVMYRPYNYELFQVLTDNAAVKFKKSSVSVIELLDSGATRIFSERGKMTLLYGKDRDNRDYFKIKGKAGFEVLPDHSLKSSAGLDMDFMLWNRKINAEFDKLHYGKSKVPGEIFRYGKAVAHWAKRWSTMYGEWIYDDIFGYMWKPADEMFAQASYRPFFMANFITINNELFLVPQQRWGKVPAQLGTWVFLKKTGWTWMPGSASLPSNFSSVWFTMFGTRYYGHNLWVYSCFNDYLVGAYGSYDLFRTYCQYGVKSWRESYARIFGKHVKAPKTKHLSKDVRRIFKKINKANFNRLSKVKTYSRSLIKSNMVRPIKKIKGVSLKGVGSKKAIGFRDFNPDVRYFGKRQTNIFYSNKTNDIHCPKLRIRSSKMSIGERTKIMGKGRRSRYSGGSAGSGGFSRGSGTSHRESGSSSSGSGGGGKSKG